VGFLGLPKQKARTLFLDKVTEILSVLSICLVETERTVKEVWFKVKKYLRSDLDIRFISTRSFNIFEMI
jgi:hypothetical protein